MTDENSTTATGPAPPTPNPMFDGVNRYPRPETGTNWPLARATREFIASLPVRRAYSDVGTDGQGWVQQDWRCRTGMCYAGWASALTGAKFLYAADNEDDVDVDFSHFGYVDDEVGGERELKPGSVSALYVVEDADGKTWHVQAYARHMLGISYRASSRLFAGMNDLFNIDYLLSKINDDGTLFDPNYDVVAE